jgi:hypothetical protein
LWFGLFAVAIAVAPIGPIIVLISALRILAVSVHAEWLLLERLGSSCSPPVCKRAVGNRMGFLKNREGWAEAKMTDFGARQLIQIY